MNRTTCHHVPLLLLLAFSLIPGPNLLAATTTAPQNSTKNPVAQARSELIRAAAEVLTIDQGNRVLTLKREDGNTLTVIADKRVTNLSRVSVGDIVIAQYGHAQAISLKKLGTESPDAPETSLPSLPAGAPNKAPASVKSPPRRSLVADIIAIDDRTRQATLKGINGAVVDVVFRTRKPLASVRIGDRVRLEYTEAVAVSIKPAGQAVSSRRQPPL